MGTLKVTIAVGDSQGTAVRGTRTSRSTPAQPTPQYPERCSTGWVIPVERSPPSETADGSIVPVDVGEATIRLEGLQFHTPVIFAEENEPSLLGVVSLEQAALGVNPWQED